MAHRESALRRAGAAAAAAAAGGECRLSRHRAGHRSRNDRGDDRPLARSRAIPAAQSLSCRSSTSSGQSHGAGQYPRTSGAALRRGSRPRVGGARRGLRDAHFHSVQAAERAHGAAHARTDHPGAAAMSPLRLLLVDDEAPARERLREVLSDVAGAVPHTIVGEAPNGPAALALLREHPVDAVLVDVHMRQVRGIEFARQVLRTANAPAIMFTTAHDQHAVHAFEVNAIDYLLKPVRAARLQAALQKVRPVAAESEPNAAAGAGEDARRFLSVTERGRILLVPLADVLYLKAELKYVTVRTREREHVIEESLTRLEQEFGDVFVRVHR